MLNIYKSDSGEKNKAFKEVEREGSEDNLKWLARHLGGGKKNVRLLLVGGRNLSAFRLRVAQAHLRHDFTPSHWSHVALLGSVKEDIGQTIVHEISLEPPGGFGGVSTSNALQKWKLAAYADSQVYPNVGVVNVPITRASLTEPLVKFQHQRAILDGPQLVLLWLAYVWGAGSADNPLLSGNGIPSSAMIEAVVGAAGFDLTPGTESRASCPEAIYQSAMWWHHYHQSGPQRKALAGAYHLGDRMEYYPSPYDEMLTAGDEAQTTGGETRPTRARGIVADAPAPEAPPKVKDAYTIADPE